MRTGYQTTCGWLMRLIVLDTGLINPGLLANYDEATQEMWRRTRIRD